jgi:lipoyl-dependent peroxiredoxin
MVKRHSEAQWNGTLKEGHGTFKLGSKKVLEGAYSFPSRFEAADDTNPEELIAAAHAACFSMALSAGMDKDGLKPKRVHTVAHVTLEKVGEGFEITGIELVTEAEVPGLNEAKFIEYAEAAKKGCPISKALASVKNITLTAKLLVTV